MIKELKVQAEKDRQALKRPPLIEQEIQLKYGEVALDNDEKKLIEYGRIKDGSILQFARKLTAYHAIKMNEKQVKELNENSQLLADLDET